MKTRQTITLALGLALLGVPAAQAHMLRTEHSLPTRAAASSSASAAALKAAGIRFQGRKNVREERLIATGSAPRSHWLRPDDRPGIHGAGLALVTSA